MKDGAIMKLAPNKLFQFIVPAVMLASLSISIHAQGTQPQQNAGDVAQTQTQADQMLGPLNLTQDQIQRIRSINADLREERQAAGMRLRLAQRALTEAIQSSTPDETLISQRSKEVADAQANTIRLRSLTEARILQVLTPEQRIKLRELRQQAMIRRNGNQQMPRALQRRQNALQRNQNPNALTPRQQQRILREQQQPRKNP
jgi:Spy/CpxP family protein refolding chaperone